MNMAEDTKYNICTNCGAIIEKDTQYCGHCGAQAQIKQEQTEYSQSYSQTGYQQSYQPSQPVYERSKSDAESRLKMARVFAWLGCLGTIFAIVAIVLALDTKKTLGDDPRIKQTVNIAIIMIVISVLVGIGASIGYVFFYMSLGFF
jgi:hypothetical protein